MATKTTLKMHLLLDGEVSFHMLPASSRSIQERCHLVAISETEVVILMV